MSWIKLSGVKKNFGATQVLRGIELELPPKELCVIRGSSGSGKSTLLYLMGGLDQPNAGEVVVAGKRLSQMNPAELALYRNRQVGFVFQFHFLLPSMTARQNCLLPAQIADVDLVSVEKQIETWAQHLGISHILDKYPHQLSGGEQQRVNIIRAISLRPPLLLCDEPTGNLDSKNSQIVIQLLTEIAQTCGSTLVVVTHDDKVASFFSRKISIEDGRIIG
jgi:lipoprotein-releasing system ATP-binding protein